MKFSKLLLTIIPLMLLVSCQNNNPIHTSSGSGDGQDTSTTGNLGREVLVYYFSNGINININLPYYTGHEHANSVLKDVPENPVSEDPAFNYFVGWSLKPIAASMDDIWNVEKDVIPEDISAVSIKLYGIWDYVSEGSL